MRKEGSWEGRDGGGGGRAGWGWVKAGSIWLVERGRLERGNSLDVGFILNAGLAGDDAFSEEWVEEGRNVRAWRRFAAY